MEIAWGDLSHTSVNMFMALMFAMTLWRVNSGGWGDGSVVSRTWGFLQRTHVWSPASTLGGSQSTLTPDLGSV